MIQLKYNQNRLTDVLVNGVSVNSPPENTLRHHLLQLFECGAYQEWIKCSKEHLFLIESSQQKIDFIKNIFHDALNPWKYKKTTESINLADFALCIKEIIHNSSDLEKQKIKSHARQLLNQSQIEILLSSLVLTDKFNESTFLIKFFNIKAQDINNLIRAVCLGTDKNKLTYILDNIETIKIDINHLASTRTDISTVLLDELINCYDYNPFETDEVFNMDTFQMSVLFGNNATFKYLLNKYPLKFTLNKPFKINSNESSDILDIIGKKRLFEQYLFLERILAHNNLIMTDSESLQRISKILFNFSFLREYYSTDIYRLFFSHPEFNHSKINLGQTSFLYGLLENIQKTHNTQVGHNGKIYWQLYQKILSDYFNTAQKTTHPYINGYHILGAAIAALSNYPDGEQAIETFCINFPEYINKKNPNGKFPIEQGKKNIKLYNLLLSNGAIEKQSGIRKIIGKKYKQISSCFL